MPNEKPVPVGPRYEAIDPTLPADQWDDAEPSNVEELDRRFAQQSSKELKKVAIYQSRLRAVPRIIALLVPVAISFTILQLSWRHVYWRDSNQNPRAISENVAILQIAAKAHEILIVLSLSDVVLHHLRQQISSSHGLPFGLFTSAYQVALGSQPLSFGFFYSLRSSLWRRNVQWRTLTLSLFLLLSTLLGLAAGPSSAIVLIPRLDWWPDDDLFSLYTSTDNFDNERPSLFTVYIPKRLFPNAVDVSSLPGTYCMNATLDSNGSCPSAGFQYLLPTFNFTATIDNVTLDAPLRRAMATKALSKATASTWTTNHVLANYMSVALGPDDLYYTNRNPYTIESITQRNSVLSPIINVVCEQQPASFSIRNMAALAGGFNIVSGGYDEVAIPSGEFDVRTIWNFTNINKSNTTLVAFEEDPPNATVPGLLAFVYVPGTMENSANISMCGISGKWESSTMSMLLDGGRSGNILSNFTWFEYDIREAAIYDDANRERRPLKSQTQFAIRKSWADALNPTSDTSTTSVLAQLLQDGAKEARNQGGKRTNLDGGIVQSIILSKAFADGIARIGAEYRVHPLMPKHRNVTVCRNKWCSSGPYINPGIEPKVLNFTWDEWREKSSELTYGQWQEGAQLFQSYPEPDDLATQWTQLSFPMKRYGYAWSFSTKTVKVATVVLMLHTLIIAIHCFHLLFVGRSYNFASSLGDLIALALNSHPPAALSSTSVAIKKDSNWARRTAVRELQGLEKDKVDRLELVADEDGINSVGDGFLHRRVITGKRYQ